ncbi:MAG: DUF3098 domain-containing protein [Alloprevotella sp.]|nr:DUF3098 domain-containing protein [Alloprevotella sp.]
MDKNHNSQKPSADGTQKPRVFAFTRTNYLLIAAGVLIVIVGMILMSGSGSDPSHFNPDIFSVRRIRVAPLVCLLGYLIVGAGILYSPRRNRTELHQ